MNPIRIALIYDVPGWACESECLALAKFLKRYAPDRFKIDLKSNGYICQQSQYDIIMSTTYYCLTHASHPRSVAMVSSYAYWIRKAWTAEQNKETGIAHWPHLKQWKYMVAHNKEIFDMLLPEDHPNITLLYHCFDEKFWSPSNTLNTHTKFRVGFAGHKQDLKGLNLISTAISKIKDTELVAPTYESGRIPHDKMPDFYRSLDCYICASKPGQDAGPRPPIEAGLCGIPVITTNTGQIGEMIINEENGLVIERSVEAIINAVKRLQSDYKLLTKLSTNIRPSFLQKWIQEVGQNWTNYLLNIAEKS